MIVTILAQLKPQSRQDGSSKELVQTNLKRLWEIIDKLDQDQATISIETKITVLKLDGLLRVTPNIQLLHRINQIITLLKENFVVEVLHELLI